VRKKAVTKKISPAKKSSSRTSKATPKAADNKATAKAAAKKASTAKPAASRKKTSDKSRTTAKPKMATKAALKNNTSLENPDIQIEAGDFEQDFPTSYSPPVVPYERKKNSNYMNAKQLTHFRELLREWKQQLMEEVDRTVGHMKDDATNFPDPNDRATQEEEFSLELRTRDRERKLIKKINEAQKRIDDDEFGYCETCGIEIGADRLTARPTAELCIDCKTLEEIRERQIA